MKEEIQKIEEYQKKLEVFMDEIYAKHKCLNREVVFSAMIIKKTIDILSVSQFAIKNYIISVQISLLRLLCDNCLAIQAAKELGLQRMIEMINNGEKISSIMIDEEQNMSDGYLKRLVAKRYAGFDKLYNFCCEGVHFSKQALSSAFYEENGKVTLNIKAGNKELKNEIKTNNAQMQTLCKVIMDMLKGICY